MTALELFEGGLPTFTFINDPEWVGSLTDIELYLNGSNTRYDPIVVNLDTFNYISPGRISIGNITYSSGLTMKWVFVANGYADIVVEVKIP